MKKLVNKLEKNGWFKMFWDLFDELTPEAALLLAYLIEVEPVMKNREGNFFRLSNSFIQEKFWSWSDYTIKTKLDELIENGFIEVQQKIKVEHSRGCKTRWIKINDKVENNLEDNSDDNGNDNGNDNSKNFAIKETKENKDTKDNKDNIAAKATRKSLKEQIVEYIDSLDYEPETKDVLFKWIFNIGIKRKVSVQQLKDMLKNIWEECNDNELLVRESINNSYLNGYFGFFAPKVKKAYTEKPKTFISPPREEIKKPEIRKQTDDEIREEMKRLGLVK